MKSRHWRWKIRRRLEASCKRGTRVVSSPRRLVNSGFVCKHYLFLAVPRSFSRGLPVKGNDDVSATVEEEQGRKRGGRRREGQETGRGPPADVRTDGWTDHCRAVRLLLLLLFLLLRIEPHATPHGNHVAKRSAYLGSGRTIFLLARAAGVHLLFSIAIR